MADTVTKPLSSTILVIITISVALVMASVTYFTAFNQTRDMKEDMTLVARDLASVILSGIEYPMSVGDSETVKKQLLETSKKMEGIEILICDSLEKVVYASHIDKINTQASGSLFSEKGKRVLTDILGRETTPPSAIEEEVNSMKTLVTMFPVLNKQECHRCHGSAKKVLGGIIIRMSTDRTYANIVNLRNTNIFISLLGIFAIIVLLYVLLTKKVTAPLVLLVEKINDFTAKISTGDYTMRLDLKRDDEIGVLVSSFNLLADALEQKNQAINSSNKKLARANKELEAFAYSVSHDLRAPLRNIDGFSKILLEEYADTIDAQGKHYLQRVRNGTCRMGNLIDDILSFSRAGRMELRCRPIACNNLITDILPEFSESLLEKNIEVTMGDLPAVMGDSSLLQSVFANLISNAIKFSKQDGQAKIAIGFSEEHRAIFVQDNGIGFEMVYHDKIFQLFQRLHLPEEFEGTGLGLAIIKRIVERHKGTIWAAAIPGQGATFYLQLPLAQETSN